MADSEEVQVSSSTSPDSDPSQSLFNKDEMRPPYYPDDLYKSDEILDLVKAGEGEGEDEGEVSPKEEEEEEEEEEYGDEQLVPDSTWTPPPPVEDSGEAEPQVPLERDTPPSVSPSGPAQPSAAFAAFAEEEQPPADSQQLPSYVPSSSSSPPCKAPPSPPLMQFPTELGQKGACPAPLSPLHTPDSLEELSLTESPNRPYPPALSPRDHAVPSVGAGSTAPYLSLGQEAGPRPTCEDSGVSFSPEEKRGGSRVSPDPTRRWDSPFPAARETPDDPPAYRPRGDPSDDRDDLMYEEKDGNPFDGFSPLADSGSYRFGEREERASPPRESPNPDLVRYGESEEDLTADPKAHPSAKPPPPPPARFSPGLEEEEEEEEEEDGAPPAPSLPDILKSSPLNPEKADSGSSEEGSPEEQSPVLERRMMESPNPPINLSANNPFALDAKVSLLKEMAERMEVGGSEAESSGPLDLLKEAEDGVPAGAPAVTSGRAQAEREQKDWFSGATLEPLRSESQQDWDSERAGADIPSPFPEAAGRSPAPSPRAEAAEPAEEVSEHEVSSEEFEFIERPPKGAMDEFLEALEPSKSAPPHIPEIPADDEEDEDNDGEREDVSSGTAGTYCRPTSSEAEVEKAPGRFRMAAGFHLSAVADLLYWRDVKTTGAVFGATLLVLLSLTVCSIISVCSYVSLALLSVTICFRIYKTVVNSVQKLDGGHPFKQYLACEVALPEDLTHKYGDAFLDKINGSVAELRRLFLVEDLVDSIKFAVLMWIMTYVGALFNGLTLLILAVIVAFTWPIVYERHEAQITHYVDLVYGLFIDISAKIKAKVPGMKPKAE
ncbi:uncharacterized protein LOC144205145 [Stigmatopora nigra]